MEQQKYILKFPKSIKLQTLEAALEKNEFGIFNGLARMLLDAPISEGGISADEINEIFEKYNNTMTKTDRQQSLEWWRSLTDEEKNQRIDIWKELSKNDYRSAYWTNDMISNSSSTIELIWKATMEQEKLNTEETANSGAVMRSPYPEKDIRTLWWDVALSIGENPEKFIQDTIKAQSNNP